MRRAAARGQGYTVNYPMPPNTDFATWRAALAKALAQIADYAPEQADHLAWGGYVRN